MEHFFPASVTDVAIFSIEKKLNSDENQLKLLLYQRQHNPELGKWALPGTFMTPQHKNAEECAKDGIKTKTGIDCSNLYLELVNTQTTFDEPLFQKQPEKYFAYDTLFFTLIPMPQKKPLNAEWFNADIREELLPSGEKTLNIRLMNDDTLIRSLVKLPSNKPKKFHHPINEYEILETDDKLAFLHPRLIANAVERMRYQARNYLLAFNAMPEYFTINQVKHAYEAVLGCYFTPQNFRKMMMPVSGKNPLILKTGLTEPSTGCKHRPAEYYKRNPEIFNE